MKKPMLIITALAIVAFGCTKKKDNSTVNTTPTITLNGVTYNQLKGADSVTTNFFGHSVNTFLAVGTTTDNSKLIGVYAYSFNSNRPSAGTHNIGGSFNVSAANQMQLLVIDSNATGQGLYSADTVTTLNLTITESGGKLTATIPSIRLSGFFTPKSGSTYNDTITFSGTMTEK